MVNYFKKHSGVITVVGLILFLFTWGYITYEINQNNRLEQLSTILSSMNMDRLKEFYRDNPTSFIMNFIDYICIMGYVLFISGFITLYDSKCSQQKRIKLVNRIMLILGILVGVVDIVETTITAVGSLYNFNISNIFMYIHTYGTYFKGLIWIIFLWILILSVVGFLNLFVKREKN